MEPVLKPRHVNRVFAATVFSSFALIFSFLLEGALPSIIHAEDQPFLKIARQWADDRYNRNSNTVKEFFKELETKDQDTVPNFAVEPLSLGLSQPVKRSIPESIESVYLLKSLLQYKIDNRSLIRARYERKDEDEPLKTLFTVFVKSAERCTPLVFPFEVASINIAKNSGTMPVLLSMIEGGHGSGTSAHVYKLRSDGTIEQLMELGMWQASMVQFVDIDKDGNAEILHVTLSHFPEELIKHIGPAEDLVDYRFYQAEIYKWIDDSTNSPRTNKFKRIGVKYYWKFPSFMEASFSLKEGWDRCDALSTPWIATRNAAMPEHIKKYFLDIEASTKPPVTSAVVPSLQLDVNEAQRLAITEIGIYQRWPGDKRTQPNLVDLRKIDVDERIFVIASYKDEQNVLLHALYVYDSSQFRMLNVDPIRNRLQDNIQLVKLGKDIPLLINTSSTGTFGDTFFYAITSDGSLEQKLKLNLFEGQFWFKDVDNDGDTEVILFNNSEAPAGVGRILEENDLGSYALYIPRVTIYKWASNGFIKLAVRYFSKREDLPDGLIKEALMKIHKEEQR